MFKKQNDITYGLLALLAQAGMTVYAVIGAALVAILFILLPSSTVWFIEILVGIAYLAISVIVQIMIFIMKVIMNRLMD